MSESVIMPKRDQEDERSKIVFAAFPETKSDEFVRLFPGNREELVHHFDGTLLRTSCSQQVEKIYRFPVKSDDVWIVTFPKSGKCFAQLNKLFEL